MAGKGYTAGDWECPTCGRAFNTENGMKVHHAKTHGESISGVETDCSYCGESTRVGRKRLEEFENVFCGSACMGKWQAENRVGKNHPTYSRVEVECDNCGELTETFPHRIERQEHHFCDKDCHGEWISGNLVGENNPNWKGGDNDTVCAYCGEPTTQLRPNEKKTERAFCDRVCFMAWHAENMVGEASPRWKGGHERYYGPRWQAQREKALERDGHECQICGKHKSELDVKLHVHHKIPFIEFRESGDVDYEAANDLENLITLCLRCHYSTERFAPLVPTV